MLKVPARASDTSQASLSSGTEQVQALQEQAADADTPEAAVKQDIAEEAACAEALSIALSGEPPLITIFHFTPVRVTACCMASQQHRQLTTSGRVKVVGVVKCLALMGLTWS